MKYSINRKFIIIILIASLVILFSCDSNMEINGEADMIKLVKEIEVAHLYLWSEKISFERYSKKVEHLSKHISQDFFEGQYPFTEKETYEKHINTAIPTNLENVIVKISEVYNVDYDENSSNKFVYTQVIYHDFISKDNDLIKDKRYEFVKQNGKWKIIEIVADIYDTSMLETRTFDDGSIRRAHLPKLNKHNGEDINYIDVFRP